MISAFRTGQIAGSAAFRDHPHYLLDEQQQAAFLVLEQRKYLGITHWIPEEEFIRGFLDGYQHPTSTSDGLQLFTSFHLP